MRAAISQKKEMSNASKVVDKNSSVLMSLASYELEGTVMVL